MHNGPQPRRCCHVRPIIWSMLCIAFFGALYQGQSLTAIRVHSVAVRLVSGTVVVLSRLGNMVSCHAMQARSDDKYCRLGGELMVRPLHVRLDVRLLQEVFPGLRVNSSLSCAQCSTEYRRIVLP